MLSNLLLKSKRHSKYRPYLAVKINTIIISTVSLNVSLPHRAICHSNGCLNIVFTTQLKLYFKILAVLLIRHSNHHSTYPIFHSIYLLKFKQLFWIPLYHSVHLLKSKRHYKIALISQLKLTPLKFK